MLQPTAAVSVSRQTMPVGGVSTTKCAVVLQVPALTKQTVFKLVIQCHTWRLVYACFVVWP